MAALSADLQLDTAIGSSHGDSDDCDDLSDQQIHDLLRDAERRLWARPPHAPRGQSTTLPKCDTLLYHHSLPHQASHGCGVEKLTIQSSLPQISLGDTPQPYVNTTGEVARIDSSRYLALQGKGLANNPRLVEDPIKVKKKLMKEKEATAGPDWFNLPRTNLTPQLKRDLQLLRLRSVLDPKRHYKKDNSKGNQFPEFSQVGTIVEGSTEFFSARIPNRQRKKTYVDEVLAGEKESGYFGRKYSEVQASKMSGKKAFYKRLKERRSTVGKSH